MIKHLNAIVDKSGADDSRPGARSVCDRGNKQGLKDDKQAGSSWVRSSRPARSSIPGLAISAGPGRRERAIEGNKEGQCSPQMSTTGLRNFRFDD